MRALTISRPGGPEVLEIRSVPEPSIGPDEVLVRVRASALNRADVIQRRGLYPAPPGAPADIPGLEFAGELEACGPLVATLQPADRVMGIVSGGGQAEKLRIHERLCLRIPPGMSFEDAAAVPEAFLTAYDALFLRGGLRPGEAVLLHAAGSGVGTAAAAMATVAGARVVALSRSADKRRRLESMGVHRVFDPATSNIAEAIRMAAGGEGVALAIDLIGASSWTLNLDVLELSFRNCERWTLIDSPQRGILELTGKDRFAFLQRIWNTKKIPHRALVATYLKDNAGAHPDLYRRAESLLTSATTDADATVRELALATLAQQKHPAVPRLAAALLRDADPQMRLLGRRR